MLIKKRKKRREGGWEQERKEKKKEGRKSRKKKKHKGKKRGWDIKGTSSIMWHSPFSSTPSLHLLSAAGHQPSTSATVHSSGYVRAVKMLQSVKVQKVFCGKVRGLGNAKVLLSFLRSY